jgi:phosphate transport system permease protein
VTMFATPDLDDRPEPVDDRPRSLHRVRRESLVDDVVAALAGLHVVLLLRVLLDWDDLLGSVLLVWLGYVGFAFLLARARDTTDVAVDRLVTTAMWSTGLAVVGVLGWMTSFVVLKGWRRLSWEFVTSDLGTVGALDEGGGVAHGIVGTAEQVGLAVLVVVPIGILTAVYLNEIGGHLARPIRFFVDSLAGLPSVLAGLLVITIVGFPQAGYKGSIALAVLTLPIMTRTSEEILKTVPDGLREASLALGAPQWKVVSRVVLPTARDGLLTAAILVVARAAGETAPVVLTAGYSASTNWNPFNGTQATLPTVVFDLIRKPNQAQIDRAWGGALVLLLFVLLLFVLARITASRANRRLGRK